MTTRISNSVVDLIGQGEEYLVVDDVVLAKFYDGQLVTDVVVIGNKEVTLVSN